MILTEEQRAALKRVVAYMDEMYAIASPYYGCTEDANILRAMIDSSGTVEPVGGFDLEKVREAVHTLENFAFASGKITAGQIQDVLWGARLLAASAAEIERLRASLIDLHAEYINTLEKNPECSAWDLDEQSDADQKRLRRNAAHAISIVEPPIYLQAEQRATRIKELEDAHKRSGAKYAKIINELRSSVYANMPGLKKQWDEILNAPANGKIGPDADAKPQVWQITEERKAAIKELSELLTAIGCPSCHYYIQKNYGENITVLRAMLTEAGQE